MSNILAYTSPALGNLSPMCALLGELVQRGHHVDVRTLATGVPVARSIGCVAEPIDSRIEAIEMTDWKAKRGAPALKVAFGVFAQRAALEVDDLRAAIAASHPDAVLVDANCWGAAVAAEASGVPWLAFWPYFPFLRSPGIPPFGPGLRPWPGVAGRIRDRLLDPVVTGQLTTLMLRPVNALRSEMGLPPADSVDDLLRRAPLMLVASSAPFDYPRSDAAGRLHMIGPCEFDPSPAGDAAWLDDVEGPLVLVTMSSERQGDVALGVTAIAALADEPVHVVATFPAGVPPGIVLPANASAVEFVSHAAVLGRAVCAVTHGGMGGTQKALARGVPVCVVPHGRDQFEVARRVEVARCGTWLPPRRLTASRLKAKALQAISMTEGARRVAEGFVATGGVRRGADVVESRLLTV
jgi:MGT family glycosyltransferase